MKDKWPAEKETQMKTWNVRDQTEDVLKAELQQLRKEQKKWHIVKR